MSDTAEPDAKRTKTAADRGTDVNLADFTLHETSGWYISNADPAWQYNAHTGLFFHAQQGAYYVFNAATGGYDLANLAAAAAADADAPQAAAAAAAAAPAAIIPLAVTVSADYTFMQGRRPHQEDRHTMETDFGPFLGHAGKYFAVFDGHGGSEASEFCSKTFHAELLAASAALAKQTAALASDSMITEAINVAAAKTDKEFLRIAKIRKRRDGCCAVAALFLGRKLVIINVGDSRAVLCTAGQAVALSTDHKPEAPLERARIEAVGGQVLKYGPAFRVTTPASLEWEKLKIKPSFRPMQPAVARSFGDLEMKQPVQYLVSTPEVTIRTVDPRDEFVILACDGVWDVLSNAEAAALVLGCPADATLRDRAGAVVKAAFDRGSTDNISVVVIDIRGTK